MAEIEFLYFRCFKKFTLFLLAYDRTYFAYLPPKPTFRHILPFSVHFIAESYNLDISYRDNPSPLISVVAFVLDKSRFEKNIDMTIYFRIFLGFFCSVVRNDS